MLVACFERVELLENVLSVLRIGYIVTHYMKYVSLASTIVLLENAHKA